MVLRFVPLALSHIHLASALFNSADDTRVLNCRSKVLTEAEDCLHAALLLKINAHLDFKREDLKQHASLLHIKEFSAAKVTVSAGSSLRSQACLL